MPPVAAAHKKLRETKFFYGRLHDTHRKLGHGIDPEEFEYFLSAFLSAGRSVLAIHAAADGQWKIIKGKQRFYDNWNFIEKWRESLVKSGRQADADLISAMKGERDQSVHKQGPSLTTAIDWIPVTEIVATDRSHPAYGFHWFGPPGTEPPRLGRTVYTFNGSGDDVLKAAERYLTLLDEFTRAYDSAPP
jgi:hypothetical protein